MRSAPPERLLKTPTPPGGIPEREAGTPPEPLALEPSAPEVGAARPVAAAQIVAGGGGRRWDERQARLAREGAEVRRALSDRSRPGAPLPPSWYGAQGAYPSQATAESGGESRFFAPVSYHVPHRAPAHAAPFAERAGGFVPVERHGLAVPPAGAPPRAMNAWHTPTASGATTPARTSPLSSPGRSPWPHAGDPGGSDGRYVGAGRDGGAAYPHGSHFCQGLPHGPVVGDQIGRGARQGGWQHGDSAGGPRGGVPADPSRQMGDWGPASQMPHSGPMHSHMGGRIAPPGIMDSRSNVGTEYGGRGNTGGGQWYGVGNGVPGGLNAAVGGPDARAGYQYPYPAELMSPGRSGFDVSAQQMACGAWDHAGGPHLGADARHGGAAADYQRWGREHAFDPYAGGERAEVAPSNRGVHRGGGGVDMVGEDRKGGKGHVSGAGGVRR